MSGRHHRRPEPGERRLRLWAATEIVLVSAAIVSLLGVGVWAAFLPRP